MELPFTAGNRRHDLDLRLLLDQLYPRVESLYDTSRTWGGAALTTLVYRVVRESCPQLDATRVQILVTAMQRVHRERRARGDGAPPRSAVRPAETT